MATIVTRTCDRCKKDVPQSEQLWDVAITCEAQGLYRASFHTPTKQQKAEWCRLCVDEMDVMVGLLRADSPPPKYTFEDLVREIVEECNNGRD